MRTAAARPPERRPSHEISNSSRRVLGLFADPTTALAVMFAVGSGQGMLVLALPHWPIANPGLVFAVALGGFASAPLIFFLRRLLPPWSRHLVLASGSVAASVGVLGCGGEPSSMTAGYIYFLIVLYAAAYFSPIAAVSQLIGVGAGYALALGINPTSAFPSQWAQVMILLSVTALLVGGFALRVRMAAATLRFQSFHDALTGLANRSLFLDRVDHALRRTQRESDPVAVLFLDVDDFKTVNDSLGHSTGDELIKAVTERLNSVVRAGDTLARLGGDEFALLLESGNMPQTAEAIAARIAETLDEPFALADTEVTARVSIGIAVADKTHGGPEDLLRDADLAMYLAKQNGKNRFEMVRPGMQDAALKRLALVADLRHAVDGNEFEVFYQPIVDVGDVLPVGAEALVRWHHPQLGLVSPVEFIGAAEAAGLIVTIGDWVLNEACRQAAAWRKARTIGDAFYISVNLSPRQLAEPTVVDHVANALRRSGLPPRALVLEITESALVLDFDAGLARLLALKDLGLRLALDDYGTGYSSLDRLRRFPIDIVKIDKSFVDDVGQSGADTALVRSVIDVTRALGIISVAEGVESSDQYDALRELGCDAIQGYLFARPAPGEDTALTLLRLASTAPPRSRMPLRVEQ